MTKLFFAAAVVVSALSSQEAIAQSDNPSGKYAVTLDQVSDSCPKDHAAPPRKASLTIMRESDRIVVSLTSVPQMTGPLHKRGRFKVAGNQDAPDQDGLRGKYTANGRVQGNAVRMVLVAEFYKKDGKALCTQSWNISGKRQ